MNFLGQTAEPMNAAVFEGETRPGHQIANRFGYDGFTGAGGGGDPGRDVNRDAADLIAFQVNLADMDTAAHGQTERRDRIVDRHRAPNRTRRTIKDADKAVPAVADFPAAKPLDLVARRLGMPIKQYAPVPIAQFRHPSRRFDDIGYQDGGQDTVVLDLWR
jgi:hypothetical protein